MARERRVATVLAKELALAEAEDSNRGSEFEESDDELNAVELTPEDLYEDTAPLDDEEYEDVAKEEEVAEKAIAKGPSVYVIYKGMKNGDRSPVAITVTVPYGGTKATDPTALITQGETYVLRPGIPVGVSSREARWLQSHPVYNIEKS